MRGMIAIAGVVAVTVAACDRPQPVALNAPPPTPYSAPYQYPPPAVAMVPGQAPRPMYAQAKCQGPGGLDIGDYAWVQNLTPDDITNGGWEVCPGKVVMPATYCRWAGLGRVDKPIDARIAN